MDSVQKIGDINGLLKHIPSNSKDSLENSNLPKLEATSYLNIISNDTILKLISNEKSQEALAISLANCDAMRNVHGNQHQFTLNSIANLLEHSVSANNAILVSQEHIELLHGCALNPQSAFGHFHMRVTSRLCEFSAHFGAIRPELKEIAVEMLENLHFNYPLANINDESKVYCARASLVAASHIARWELKKERPDFRRLDYITSCAHERLAFFGLERSDFYMGLYQLRRGETDHAISSP